MTTKAQRERTLQGQDPMVNLIVGYLLASGWEGDRILKNVASKEYSPNRAVVRVELDAQNKQYWVTGEYTSAGVNVLGTGLICIRATALPEQVASSMAAFVQDAELRISQSFAVRFLGDAGIFSDTVEFA